MRLALISDIHGNALALETVLAELGREEFDQLLCLGDVAVGPQPREALERVRELGCPVIMGNWDGAFLSGMPPAHDEVARKLSEISAWWADQLSPDDLAYLETFVPRLQFRVGTGSEIVCFHGSPRSYDDWIFATTPDREIEEMVAGFAAPLMIGGHTHLQMTRRHELGTIVNPGSVGLPFLHWWPNTVVVARWAEYALVEFDGGRLRVDARRTEYDADALLRISLSSGMPHAEWWAGTWAPA